MIEKWLIGWKKKMMKILKIVLKKNILLNITSKKKKKSESKSGN